MSGALEAAYHEAGHAVMRWLRGWPLTALTAREDGSGLCAGTGRRVRAFEHIEVLLAGPAAEVGIFWERLDWERSRFNDFDDAREVMRALGCYADVEAALRDEFKKVAVRLADYSDLIETIADRLYVTGSLSARAVAAYCREHGRREARQQTAPDAATPGRVSR